MATDHVRLGRGVPIEPHHGNPDPPIDPSKVGRSDHPCPLHRVVRTLGAALVGAQRFRMDDRSDSWGREPVHRLDGVGSEQIIVADPVLSCRSWDEDRDLVAG